MALQISAKLPLDESISRSDVKREGSLRPTTSNDTGESTGFTDPCSMRISTGSFIRSRLPEPAYLPLHWSAHIHPEGQLYFCRDGPFRVVTEAYIYRPDVLDKAICWIQKIEDRITDKRIAISNQTELFIKLEDEDCAYYLVDHTTNAQFWLEDIETETNDLGLPPVVSTSHFSIVCEELYWSHVERFPMHIGGLSLETLDSLVCVFMHAICDQMTSTSRVSTFPYSKEECEGFVTLLKNSRVAHNRYLTHFGQEYSRLSRDQTILYGPEISRQWISTVASLLSLKTSDRYLVRLNDVFVDHLVYAEQWKAMVTDCLRDWEGASHRAFTALMLHQFLLALTSNPTLAAASASLFGASLLVSILLIHRYEPLVGIDATRATCYLESIQSRTFKFQFVALVFALPHILQLWGTLVFFANCIFMLANSFGTVFAAGFSVLAFVTVLVFQWTTSDSFNWSLTRFNSSVRQIRAKFCRNQNQCESVV
ncbi:hypothetical protein C8J57DRAFT_1384368 [Mycena rebaudengoi]|nr:hypothetical protein C8J57DRAFT_1384368 [Mycena rebaudengoi]